MLKRALVASYFIGILEASDRSVVLRKWVVGSQWVLRCWLAGVALPLSKLCREIALFRKRTGRLADLARGQPIPGTRGLSFRNWPRFGPSRKATWKPVSLDRLGR